MRVKDVKKNGTMTFLGGQTIHRRWGMIQNIRRPLRYPEGDSRLVFSICLSIEMLVFQDGERLFVNDVWQESNMTMKHKIKLLV